MIDTAASHVNATMTPAQKPRTTSALVDPDAIPAKERNRRPLTNECNFAWLTLGLPLDRGMFLPADSVANEHELDELAAAEGRVFISAYAIKE